MSEEEEPDVISRLATTGKSCLFWWFWIPVIIAIIITTFYGCFGREGREGLKVLFSSPCGWLCGIVAVGVGLLSYFWRDSKASPPPSAEEEKQKALRDSVLGKYEWELEGSRPAKDIGIDIPEDMRTDNLKKVFLENSIVEEYCNGVKETELKWEISNGEIHIDNGEFPTGVYRINQDKSITYILSIWDGKRTDTPKERQITFKKTK